MITMYKTDGEGRGWGGGVRKSFSRNLPLFILYCYRVRLRQVLDRALRLGQAKGRAPRLGQTRGSRAAATSNFDQEGGDQKSFYEITKKKEINKVQMTALTVTTIITIKLIFILPVG